MSKKEHNQIKIFEKLKRQEMPQKQAAERLQISTRQIKRKLSKYKKHGAQSLVHGNRGKPSKRRIDPIKVNEILNIMKTRYEGFGPTFAAEKLGEEFKINISAKTLRNYMIKENIWQTGHRKRKKHREWRSPKEHFGEMVQMVTSEHIWIPQINEYWDYIKFVDDATKAILYAEFLNAETTKNVMASTKKYFQIYGKPLMLYTDKAGIFKVNTNNPENIYITQYERALRELDVKLIHAHSPQAKGRIERSFGTDQDRLVKELKLANISTKEAANKFLCSYYIPKMNAKFTRPAVKKEELHQPVSQKELDEAFCIKSERKVHNDCTVFYHNRFFQISGSRPAIVKPGDIVTMCEYLDDTIKIKIRTTDLEFKELKERGKFVKSKTLNGPFKLHKPKSGHPWRRFSNYFKSEGDIFIWKK